MHEECILYNTAFLPPYTRSLPPHSRWVRVIPIGRSPSVFPGEKGPESGIHVDRARGVPEPVPLGVRHRLGLFAERLQPLDRPVATDGSARVQVTRAPEMTRERWWRTRALRRTVSPATTLAGFGASVGVVGRGGGAGGGGEQGESRPPRGRREPGRRWGLPSAVLHRRVWRGASGRTCQVALAWVRLQRNGRRQRARAPG